MNLRVDQLVMAGVVGIGGYLTLRLFAGGGSKESEPPPPKGEIMPPAEKPRLPNDQNVVKKGIPYYGRFDFRAPVSRAAIADALATLGFRSAIVYESIGEAEAAIPRIRLVLDDPTPGTRWFRAVAEETRTLARPPELTYVWIATG